MAAPSIESEPFITLEVILRVIPIGTTPYGTRLEVPFEGTAVSTLWDGEREVYGVDHITMSATGTARIDVHTTIMGDDEVITYRGNGRGLPTGMREGVIFETASERLAWLNDAVAVGQGTVDGECVTVQLFRITT
jgi:hypothetical protein